LVHSIARHNVADWFRSRGRAKCLSTRSPSTPRRPTRRRRRPPRRCSSRAAPALGGARVARRQRARSHARLAASRVTPWSS